MRAWQLFLQAMGGVARARLRSTLTALGVAIGCGALVAMIAFALGLQRQIETPLKRLGLLNDIHVTPMDRRGSRDDRGDQSEQDDGREEDADDAEDSEDAEGERGDDPTGDASHAPAGELAPPALLDAAAVEQFRKIEGVKYAYPDMSLSDVGIAHGDKKIAALAFALPREVGGVEQFQDMLVAGNFFSLDDAAEVVLAKDLLKPLGWDSATAALGKTVSVSTSGLATTDERGQFQFQEKTLEARVVGVIEQPGFDGFGPRSMQQVMFMPVDLLQKLPGLVESQLWRMRRRGVAGVDAYPRVTVRVASPAEVPRVAEAIRKQGFNAHTMLSQLEELRVAFLFIETVLSAVGSVALVIAGLGIANTLLMTVLERYEEIGLYKAIGATDGDVRWMFVAEAAVLGIVGSLAGLVLAAVVCWGLQWGVNEYLARQGVEKPVDVFYFPWWLLGGSVAVATVLSVVSGLYPASRAARVDPIKALRRT